MAGLYYYFVEGECEKVLLKAFMHVEDSEYYICPGKIEVLNVICDKISPAKARTLKKGSKVVFVFDIDIKKTDLLENNIDTIVKYSSIDYSDILLVQSCKTLEDEIVYACKDIYDINKLLGTTSKEDFKKKLIKHKDIVSRLKNVGFQLDKMWSREPSAPFSQLNYPLGFKEILANKKS